MLEKRKIKKQREDAQPIKVKIKAPGKNLLSPPPLGGPVGGGTQIMDK